MKYFGEINSPKDLVTKEYVDQKIPGGGTHLWTSCYEFC